MYVIKLFVTMLRSCEPDPTKVTEVCRQRGGPLFSWSTADDSFLLVANCPSQRLVSSLENSTRY